MNGWAWAGIGIAAWVATCTVLGIVIDRELRKAAAELVLGIALALPCALTLGLHHLAPRGRRATSDGLVRMIEAAGMRGFTFSRVGDHPVVVILWPPENENTDSEPSQ